MSDDFGQTIQGLYLEGDSVSAEHKQIAMMGKDVVNDEYALVALNASGQTDIRPLTNSDVVQVEQNTAADLNATVVQSTGSNLHVQVDAGSALIGSAKI